MLAAYTLILVGSKCKSSTPARINTPTPSLVDSSVPKHLKPSSELPLPSFLAFQQPLTRCSLALSPLSPLPFSWLLSPWQFLSSSLVLLTAAMLATSSAVTKFKLLTASPSVVSLVCSESPPTTLAAWSVLLAPPSPASVLAVALPAKLTPSAVTITASAALSPSAVFPSTSASKQLTLGEQFHNFNQPT